MPQTKTRKTREENIQIIKETTLQFLKDTSYVDLSINKIAEASGINISQLYRYFPKGKPDILIAIGNDTTQRGAPDPQKYQDPEKLLKELIQFYVKTHKEQREILASLHTVFLSYPELVSNDTKTIDAGTSDIIVLQTCIRRLGIEDENVLAETTRSMFHIIDSMIHRHVLEVKITPTDEHLVELLVELILSYVKNRIMD